MQSQEVSLKCVLESGMFSVINACQAFECRGQGGIVDGRNGMCAREAGVDPLMKTCLLLRLCHWLTVQYCLNS